jgi:phage terminase large subunit-like protein
MAGDIAKTVRDIQQRLMLGRPGDIEAQGTGMIPGDAIIRTTPKHGLADAVESVFVKCKNGGTSVLQFKSYDQGRDTFQGTSQHIVHLDEECSIEIYTECLLRTMTVNGLIYLTATPLLGLTDIMLSFLPELAPAPEPSIGNQRG